VHNNIVNKNNISQQYVEKTLIMLDMQEQLQKTLQKICNSSNNFLKFKNSIIVTNVTFEISPRISASFVHTLFLKIM
jgi:hypothetical protein